MAPQGATILVGRQGNGSDLATSIHRRRVTAEEEQLEAGYDNTHCSEIESDEAISTYNEPKDQALRCGTEGRWSEAKRASFFNILQSRSIKGRRK